MSGTWLISASIHAIEVGPASLPHRQTGKIVILQPKQKEEQHVPPYVNGNHKLLHSSADNVRFMRLPPKTLPRPIPGTHFVEFFRAPNLMYCCSTDLRHIHDCTVVIRTRCKVNPWEYLRAMQRQSKSTAMPRFLSGRPLLPFRSLLLA